MLILPSFAEQPVSIRYSGGGNYTLVERSDLRRYDNGKYTGLVSTEVRSFMVQHENSFYDGVFYVSQDTRRQLVQVSEGIHDSIESAFTISPEGKLTMKIDNGYPSFRSFPAYIHDSISKGDSWQAEAERAVDPLNKNIVTILPMLVQYTYEGDSVYNGEEVFQLKAEWATRYGISYRDPKGDSELQKAVGSHKATISVSKRTGHALLVRDTVDETFFYRDGTQVAFKGTISLFTKYPPVYDKGSVIRALQRVAVVSPQDAQKSSFSDSEGGGDSNYSGSNNKNSKSSNSKGKTEKANARDSSANTKSQASKESSTPQKDKKSSAKAEISSSLEKTLSSAEENAPLAVEQTDAGLRVSIRNLRFKSDSSELLPGEEERLDQIAEILRQIPESLFLVEGHTASTGNPRGEAQLSLERAHAVAQFLSQRGIAPERFICKGLGGTRPVASNATSEGKAQNRRVEITILE